eukprot:scaffold8451_cov128-Isochrysis_galbana.AAC.5
MDTSARAADAPFGGSPPHTQYTERSTRGHTRTHALPEERHTGKDQLVGGARDTSEYLRAPRPAYGG